MADYSVPIRKASLFISCEHASFHVPQKYKALFKKAQSCLKTHRGYDIGAVNVAKYLATKLEVDLIYASYSRLFIDLNRSEHHQHLFSEYTRNLQYTEKKSIIDNYYKPYRHSVCQSIDDIIQKTVPTLHLSVHSFTPELNGIQRNADVGILYDPASKLEKEFCLEWQKNIYALSEKLSVRRNYPYRGNADGLTTALRKTFFGKNYLGVELELNQKLFQGSNDNKMKKMLADSLIKSIKRILN